MKLATLVYTQNSRAARLEKWWALASRARMEGGQTEIAQQLIAPARLPRSSVGAPAVITPRCRRLLSRLNGVPTLERGSEMWAGSLLKIP